MADGHSSNTRPAMGNLIDERRLERITKGFANAQRIRILQLIENDPELSLGDICDRLEIELTNGYEHIRKLTIAGLLSRGASKWARRGRFKTGHLCCGLYLGF